MRFDKLLSRIHPAVPDTGFNMEKPTKKRSSAFMCCLALWSIFFACMETAAFAQEIVTHHTINYKSQAEAGGPLQKIVRGVPSSVRSCNVFLLGEEVTVRMPSGLSPEAVQWQALDDRRNIVGRGTLTPTEQSIRIGNPGIGWYRIEFLDSGGKIAAWTTAAVLAGLAEPTPQDSLVCIDSATSWFAPNDPPRQERFAQLAALAGANWIRDRISWGGAEPAPGKFAENTSYDTAASIQARYGLKVLQVFHDTPGWATDRQFDGDRASRRFPRDLRILYKFCKTMAQRYKGRVLAWEPWNEANITVFGGHTIDEMCTHQKAAYLGFKAGDPDVTVCWNVYAGAGTTLHSKGVLENEAWPYFETYNIHSYDKPDDYFGSFAPARETACGRPIWLTECGITLPWKTERPWSELSSDDELQQAKFIAQSYASSLFAGVNRHFFFILGNYAEGQTQFGILRQDQTPRPGYVALAAVGRFLAGAMCIGRWLPKDNSSLRIYAFHSRPDGKEQDVLIIWSEQPIKCSLPEGLSIGSIYDYLGRPIGGKMPEEINSAAIFVLLPKDNALKLPMEPPPRCSGPRSGRASPVVLQIQIPHTATNLEQQAHTVTDKETNLEIFVYNFSDATVSGTVTVENIPDGCKLTPDRWEITVEPMEQKRIDGRISRNEDGGKPTRGGWIKLRGDFGEAGQPALAFRLTGKD